MRPFICPLLCFLAAHAVCEEAQKKPLKPNVVIKTIQGVKYTARIDTFTVKISKNDIASTDTFTFGEMSITREGTAEQWRAIYSAHETYMEEVRMYAEDGPYLSLKHILSPDTYVLDAGPYSLEQNRSSIKVRIDRTADVAVEKDILAKAKEKIAAGKMMLRIVKDLLGLKTEPLENDGTRISMDETFKPLDELVSKQTERHAMGKKAAENTAKKGDEAPAAEEQGKNIPKSGRFQAELYNNQGVCYWEGEMDLPQKAGRAQDLANTFGETLYLARKGAFDDAPVTKELLEEKVKAQEILKFEPQQRSRQ